MPSLLWSAPILGLHWCGVHTHTQKKWASEWSLKLKWISFFHHPGLLATPEKLSLLSLLSSRRTAEAVLLRMWLRHSVHYRSLWTFPRPLRSQSSSSGQLASCPGEWVEGGASRFNSIWIAWCSLRSLTRQIALLWFTDWNETSPHICSAVTFFSVKSVLRWWSPCLGFYPLLLYPRIDRQTN